MKGSSGLRKPEQKGEEMIKVGTVVQFNENHRWTGCLGIVTEAKKLYDGKIKYMVGVPMPNNKIAYIFVMNTDRAIEVIGTAVFVEKEVE